MDNNIIGSVALPNDNNDYQISTLSSESIGEEVKLTSFSSTSNYNDNFWFLDLYYPNENYRTTIRKLYFTKIPQDTIPYVKNYIYALLINNKALETIKGKLGTITVFFKILEISTINVGKADIEKYHTYLQKSSITKNKKADKWHTVEEFLKFIKNDDVTTMQLYHYDRSSNNLAKEDKYIPDYITAQLDSHMLKDDDIPLHYRLCYWILRLFPGRCTETLSYPINCLDIYHDNIYILRNKTFKNADDPNGTPRLILLDSNNETMSYLIKLIKQQQDVAQVIFNNHPEMGDFLFLCHRSRFKKSINRYMVDKNPMLLHLPDLNRFLDTFCERKEITDENGKIAHVTSHLFRHNSTTDRVESKIFRPIDLRPMTNHSNEQMFNKNYHNVTEKQLVEKVHRIEQARTGKEVLFMGKVLNSNDQYAFEYFLKQPFAFTIGNIGICTDLRGCSADKFQCLICDYFIPDANSLLYFKEQKIELEKKLTIASKMNNKQLVENIKSNIQCFETIIRKIENTVK